MFDSKRQQRRIEKELKEKESIQQFRVSYDKTVQSLTAEINKFSRLYLEAKNTNEEAVMDKALTTIASINKNLSWLLNRKMDFEVSITDGICIKLSQEMIQLECNIAKNFSPLNSGKAAKIRSTLEKYYRELAKTQKLMDITLPSNTSAATVTQEDLDTAKRLATEYELRTSNNNSPLYGLKDKIDSIKSNS